MKIIIPTILITTILLATATYADVIMETNISITNGTASIEYSDNNTGIEITTNDSVYLIVNTTEDNTTYDISGTGQGNITTEINEGEYEIESNMDNQQESISGSGFFTKTFSFLKTFILKIRLKL